MKTDIKEKIQKLLALATSPNEHEARAALLKAKELMAKNKLTEEDFVEVKKQEIKHELCMDIKWTTDSGNVWMAELCKILCEEYCCVSAWNVQPGSRTHTLVITGLADDVQVAKSMVTFAVGFINRQIRIAQRKYAGNPKATAQSYAKGFLMGLKIEFENQKEEQPEWALVVGKPDEVRKYEDSLGTKSVRTKTQQMNPVAYLKGQNDGMQFNKKKALESQQTG